ncbi:HNH endonuclease [Variovorax sp. RKNM96]|nr:HNH endonuclease [Variovorax sp. RKNM96]
MLFRRLPTGCCICVSHKTNADGYLRKFIAGKRQMFHRVILEARGVHIPEGFEVNHLCNNRGCATPAHLEVIEGVAHAVKTNKERYEFTQEAARDYWLATGCSAHALAERYGRGLTTAIRWIAAWRH